MYCLLDSVYNFDHFVYDMRAVIDFEHDISVLSRKFNFERGFRGFVNSA